MIEILPRFAYLQRFDASKAPKFPVMSSAQISGDRSSFRIRAVGDNGERLQAAQTPGGSRPRLPAQSFLAALNTLRVPFCFVIEHIDGNLHLEVGTWAGASGGRADKSADILRSSLKISYPAVRIEPKLAREPFDFRYGAYVVGVPSMNQQAAATFPIDDLIRSVRRGRWCVTIMAEPVSTSSLHQLRTELFSELSEVTSSVQDSKTPNEFASGYVELLKQMVLQQNLAMAEGAWRTAVYLCGDEISFYPLASAFAGVFSGEESQAQPLKVAEDIGVVKAMQALVMPPTTYPDGPGRFHHHLAFQTILPSHALANYCQLPRKETPGFRVFKMPNLDLESSSVANGPILGHVIRHPEEIVLAPNDSRRPQQEPQTNVEGSPFRVDSGDLTSHALVVGSTGSGKTTTLFALIEVALDACGTFLIIEPAKTEYRRLLHAPWKERFGFQVFTLGANNIAPLAFNPFQPVSPDTSVATHIDLLKSLFVASFGMWAPLPQILERCIYELYVDSGWDVLTNKNLRIEASDGIPAAAWPTLSDLSVKAESVINSLGYDRKVADDMRAALLTRLDSLRLGARGRIFDTQVSSNMQTIFETPTVIELEQIGDDDDKAFVMGLLLIQLTEYLRHLGSSKRLRHLLVIEEAHRLLKQAEASGRMEDASPRAKAVETFANLLAEVREYGEGIVIVDQSPSILAPSVVKNTNLKLVHRLVAADDKNAMASALGMSPDEGAIFSALQPGFMIAMARQDDKPMVVYVDDRKKFLKTEWPGNGEVRSAYVISKAAAELVTGWRPDEFDRIKQVIASSDFAKAFSRFVLALLDRKTACDLAWENVRQAIHRRLTRVDDARVFERNVLLYASERFASARGSSRLWTFDLTDRLYMSLYHTTLSLSSGNFAEFYDNLDSFRVHYESGHARPISPFVRCNDICSSGDGQPLCLYREVIANLTIDDAPSAADTEGLWRSCLKATDGLITADSLLNGSTHIRLALCLAQHQLADEGSERTIHFVDYTLEATKELEDGRREH